jgi:hypothetical protein
MRSRRRVAALAIAAAALGAGRLAGQTPDQPNLIFTISGGYLTGGGRLWSLPRQLALAVATPNGNAWDTVALGRRFAPGFAASLSATYFKSPHLGYTAEVGYFGIATVSECSGSFAPTPSGQNQIACSSLNGENFRSDAVGLLGGLIYRFTKGGEQPYLRAAGGLAILGSSFVEEAGTVLTSNGTANIVYFLSDRTHKELSWMVSLGAGMMLPLGPGYQLRIEARDVITALPYPTGPATDTTQIAGDNALPEPPIGFRVVHLPTIMVGLDVVLERKRGHRY